MRLLSSVRYVVVCCALVYSRFRRYAVAFTRSKCCRVSLRVTAFSTTWTSLEDDILTARAKTALRHQGEQWLYLVHY